MAEVETSCYWGRWTPSFIPFDGIISYDPTLKLLWWFTFQLFIGSACWSKAETQRCVISKGFFLVVSSRPQHQYHMHARLVIIVRQILRWCSTTMWRKGKIPTQPSPFRWAVATVTDVILQELWAYASHSKILDPGAIQEYFIDGHFDGHSTIPNCNCSGNLG